MIREPMLYPDPMIAPVDWALAAVLFLAFPVFAAFVRKSGLAFDEKEEFG